MRFLVKFVLPLLACAALLFARGAAANPTSVSLPVGHTRMINIPGGVTKVQVEDKTIVQVRKTGAGVSLYGKVQGHTTVVMTTHHGEQRLKIYVAADGHAMPD